MADGSESPAYTSLDVGLIPGKVRGFIHQRWNENSNLYTAVRTRDSGLYLSALKTLSATPL